MDHAGASELYQSHLVIIVHRMLCDSLRSANLLKFFQRIHHIKYLSLAR